MSKSARGWAASNVLADVKLTHVFAHRTGEQRVEQSARARARAHAGSAEREIVERLAQRSGKQEQLREEIS